MTVADRTPAVARRRLFGVSYLLDGNPSGLFELIDESNPIFNTLREKAIIHLVSQPWLLKHTACLSLNWRLSLGSTVSCPAKSSVLTSLR